MPSTTTTNHRPRSAAQRAVALVLMVIVPLAVLSSHLVTTLGPLHGHDAGTRDERSPSHAHDHDHDHVHEHEHEHEVSVFGLARHRHAADDASVILIEREGGDDDHTSPPSNSSSAASSLLGVPSTWHPVMFAAARDAWSPGAASSWKDHVPAPPRRPPRRG